MKNKRHILIVFRKAPYGNLLAREALELALATAVFDQQLTLIFSGDGVWQLLNNQNSEGIDSKNTGKLLCAFPVYDISEIYVDADALTERQITATDLLIETQIVTKDRLMELMNQADIIFNF